MAFNNYQIKVLAAVLMLIDHIGAIFFPTVLTFRILGRFSFPLFILLLVDGEHHTRNIQRYGLRLLLLGLVSQPIFHLLFPTSGWNILFTLLLGLVGLRCARLFPRLQWLFWLIGAAIAELLSLEYGAYGIGAIALLGHFRPKLLWWIGWVMLHFGLFLLTPSAAVFQTPALLAPLLWRLANHQQGQKARWFYLFYPLHLLVLWLLLQFLRSSMGLFL